MIVGRELEEAEEACLLEFLKNNQDVFALSMADLRGVSRDVSHLVLKREPNASHMYARIKFHTYD
jgi:hypothetical protein